MTKVITMMPVRLAATRLPNKPLLNINGKTLVQRVYENVEKALGGKSDIAIAAGDQAIVDECNKFGATAILTDPALPSGTDRIAAALKVLDPKGEKYDIVVDFQGDNLNVDPAVCLPLVEMVQKTDCDIATCGMIIKNEDDKNNPNVVKIDKAKVAQRTQTPEEALMQVMKGILPNFDKDEDFFAQGLTSFDTVKMVTRCGEAGYQLELKDIYMYSTFDELVQHLK